MKYSAAAGPVSFGIPKVSVILVSAANIGSGNLIADATLSPGQLIPCQAVWGGSLRQSHSAEVPANARQTAITILNGGGI